MGIRYMEKEREDNLIEIHVYGHACVEGLYSCDGRFNTEHKFSDGFNPDDGWYRIADYTVKQLKCFKENGIKISYSDTCDDVEVLVEGKVSINYLLTHLNKDMPILWSEVSSELLEVEACFDANCFEFDYSKSKAYTILSGMHFSHHDLNSIEIKLKQLLDVLSKEKFLTLFIGRIEITKEQAIRFKLPLTFYTEALLKKVDNAYDVSFVIEDNNGYKLETSKDVSDLIKDIVLN